MAFDTNHGAVFGIIALHTSEPARTKAFYSRVFDWQEIPDVPFGAVGTDGFFMKRQGGENPEATILGAGDTGGVPVGQWIPQIAVDNIRDVAARCVEMGGEIVSEVQQVSEEDPGLMCRIRDPKGAILGLIQVVKG